MKTFREWWHEHGSKLPHDATKREIAILAWSAAMETQPVLAEVIQRLEKVEAMEVRGSDRRAICAYMIKVVRSLGT